MRITVCGPFLGGRKQDLTPFLYEWSEPSASMEMAPCGTTYGQTRNRLWDNYGFAPLPPVRP